MVSYEDRCCAALAEDGNVHRVQPLRSGIPLGKSSPDRSNDEARSRLRSGHLRNARGAGDPARSDVEARGQSERSPRLDCKVRRVRRRGLRYTSARVGQVETRRRGNEQHETALGRTSE